jgi:starch-binding outer membrane protein, SusD/RagB family
MKILKYKSLILPLAIVVLSMSCKKQVDLFPSDFINESNVFQTVTDLEQGLYAAYGAWGGENTMYLNAIISDETKISNENRGQGQFDFKWQYNPAQPGNASSGWNTFYIIIGNINKELAVLDNVATTTAAEATQKQQIKGELQALRAIAHFEMLQRFGGSYNASSLGIPYTTTSVLSATPARNTMGEVVAGIETDLTAAKAAPLPITPQVIGAFGVIRLSKSVIAAYQARVALFKGDWDNAITFATECINTCGKSLANQSDFKLLWTDQNEAELLFKIRRTGTGVGTLWQDTNGDVFFEPSDKLKNLFNRTTDVRFEAYFLIDPAGQDTALVNKFFTSPRGPKIVDVKLVRVAEMYLIRAEARAEKSSPDLVGAASDYNLLRTARITGYVNETFASKAEAVSKIMDERARELCYEGFRFFDLKRKNMAINRLASDVQSSTWQNLPANDFKFRLPIPQTATLANGSLVQNPGY